MVFLVKEELEEHLDKETRDITMPDGSIRSFTYFTLIWTYFDRLINFTDSYTEEKLAEMGVINAEETGISIENSFHDVIAYTYRQFKHICNANIDRRIAEIDKKLEKFGMANKSVSARKDRIHYIEERLGRFEGKAKADFNQAS